MPKIEREEEEENKDDKDTKKERRGRMKKGRNETQERQICKNVSKEQTCNYSVVCRNIDFSINEGKCKYKIILLIMSK